MKIIFVFSSLLFALFPLEIMSAETRDAVLMRAAERGYFDVVKDLVEAGVREGIQNGEALICAAANGHKKIVKYLVEEAGVAADIDEGEA